LLAALPLSWWAIKSSGATPLGRWHALTVLTLFLTFDLVIFGSFTRLTDSGLGCPDWPGCYGSVTAWGAKEHIDAAQAAMPTGPVTTSKAWIEMIHRKMATAIGALITLLMVLAFYWRRQMPYGPALPVFTFVWVCVQGAFGALTVTWKLFPAIVTLHLLGGMLLLYLLAAQVARHAVVLGKWVKVSVSRSLRTWMWASMALLFVQMALGAWVSTNYAVLACTEFPLCQGQWWPPMNFSDGFEIWRELGKLSSGQTIDMAAITAIHVVHRTFALVVLAVVAVLCVQLREHAALRRHRFGLMALLTLQIVTGLANVVLDWPLLAALLHTGGAAGLVILLTVLTGVTQMTDNRQTHTA
ncbi:MAG: hypothetical protein RL758_802, partial [Pseudomonadota bacterium]|jgi:cytochrome c oxidase assembly protein subunit 15